MERHRGERVAGHSEARPGSLPGSRRGASPRRAARGAQGAAAGRAPWALAASALLAVLALAPLEAAAQGARGRSVSQPATRSTRTVVVIQDLDDGRQYAAIVDRQLPVLDRMDGTLRSGDTEARVAAFLERGELRLIEERVRYGEQGGTGRNRYYVTDGRLAFFDSLRVRPRAVGEDRLPARDEVLTALAFGEDGRLVGSEKSVNRQPVPLPSTDEPGIRSRFQALAGAVAAGGAAAPAAAAR